ncbi:MAG: deaminase [Planctomycetota bacterium]|jgi:dCMP deaminase
MGDVIKKLNWLPQPITLTKSYADCLFLKDAYLHAQERSPDPSTKNGAILMDKDGKIIAYGVNKFPNGIAETESRLTNKETKYRLVVHAENGAIFNAAKHGRKTKGSTLYCPFYSCSECVKAIIQGGVERVVGHAQLMALAVKHTTWVKSIVNAWEIMHEAGVQCDLYDGIVGVTTRFNGQDIPV